MQGGNARVWLENKCTLPIDLTIVYKAEVFKIILADQQEQKTSNRFTGDLAKLG